MEQDSLNGIIKFINQMYSPSEVEVFNDGGKSIRLTFDYIDDVYGENIPLFIKNPKNSLQSQSNEIKKTEGLNKDIVDKVSSYFQLPKNKRGVGDIRIFVKNMKTDLLSSDDKENVNLNNLYYMVINLLKSGKSTDEINSVVKRAMDSNSRL